MKILISEDDLTSRIVLKKVLLKWGYEIIETTNGREALECMMDSDPPPMAILDWMMPELSGIEVCSRVQQHHKKNPPYLILLTALGEKENIVTGLDAGANDYVRKPFDTDELLARIRVGERMLQLQTSLAERIQDLEDASKHIKTLQGVLPICMHCHKIRLDNEAWERIEDYISTHSDAEFSHGLCPECLEKYYPED